jgi:hypothetical protein
MNPKYDIHERIDLYLNNEMNQADSLEFEAKLKTDENLFQTLQAQKVANQIVLGDELLKLKAQMSKDLGGNNAGNTSGKTWGYILSATLIIAIGIIIYLLNTEIARSPVSSGSKTPDSIQTNGVYIPQDLKASKDTTDAMEEKANTPLEDAAIPKKDKVEVFSDSIINFSCQARGTCIQASEGLIEIDVNTIKSGKAPYMFSVDRYSNFHEEPVISDLKAGTYNLYVKDAKQRVRKLNVKVEVPVINCTHLLK